MLKNDFDPFANLVLDKYEQELEDSLPENAFLEKVSEETLEFFRIAAQKYIQKNPPNKCNPRKMKLDFQNSRTKM